MKFEYYLSDKDNRWRWRLKASNGEVIATSEGNLHKGYADKRDCLHAIGLIQGGAPEASVEEVPG